MSSENDSPILLQVAEQAQLQPAWQPYAEYCRMREYGLRKKSLAQMEQFIEELQTWSFSDRSAFVNWLCEQTLQHGSQGENPYPLRYYGSQSLMPHPLMEEIVRPTLYEWAHQLQTDFMPHRWLGIFFPDEADHLMDALRLNPYDQPSRIADIRMCLRILDFSTHSLPDDYFGDLSGDTFLSKDVFESIAYINNKEIQLWSYHAIRYYERLIQDWIEFRQSEETDFRLWCAQQGRNYWWVEQSDLPPEWRASVDEPYGA